MSAIATRQKVPMTWTDTTKTMDLRWNASVTPPKLQQRYRIKTEQMDENDKITFTGWEDVWQDVPTVDEVEHD